MAAALHNERGTAHEMLTEAAGTASRLAQAQTCAKPPSARSTPKIYNVNIAVTLGDAGTAIEFKPIVVSRRSYRTAPDRYQHATARQTAPLLSRGTLRL